MNKNFYFPEAGAFDNSGITIEFTEAFVLTGFKLDDCFLSISL